MSKGGHFNRAARRSGGDPAFALCGAIAGIPAGHVRMMEVALDINKLADERELPVAEVIQKARDIGYIDCTDGDAEWLEKFLSEP